MRFTILSAVLATTICTVAADFLERNPPRSILRDVDFASLPPAVEPVTNAERFAQGLPPKRPRSRKYHRTSAYRDVEDASLKRGTHVASAPRAESSSIPPVQQSCKIVGMTKDTTLGYLVPELNAFGQYGRFQASQAGSLAVSFSYVPGSDAPVDLFPTNGPTRAYPYVGGAMGIASDSNSLSPGSSNYAYVVATRQAPPGSAVAGDNSAALAIGIPADYESAIWIYDPATGQIRPQWVNADGSTPKTYLLFAQDGNDALILTGDPDAVNNVFGTSYPEITFTCMPAATPA